MEREREEGRTLGMQGGREGGGGAREGARKGGRVGGWEGGTVCRRQAIKEESRWKEQRKHIKDLT